MSQDSNKFREEAERLLGLEEYEGVSDETGLPIYSTMPENWKDPVEVLAKVLEEKADCEGCRDLNSKLEVAMEEIRLRDKAEKALQNQLTEAQGKRGKVVSVEEIAGIIDSIPASDEYGFTEEDLVVVATAIFKAVYGEGQ
jgi:hypothetical protein